MTEIEVSPAIGEAIQDGKQNAVIVNNAEFQFQKGDIIHFYYRDPSVNDNSLTHRITRVCYSDALAKGYVLICFDEESYYDD